MHKNFIQATNTAKSRDVVLASHCTGDHLNHLVSLTEFWPGPISVGLYSKLNWLIAATASEQGSSPNSYMWAFLTIFLVANHNAIIDNQRNALETQIKSLMLLMLHP